MFCLGIVPRMFQILSPKNKFIGQEKKQKGETRFSYINDIIRIFGIEVKKTNFVKNKNEFNWA